MDTILSLDLGTTAIKTALFDERGKVLSKATCEYELATPSALFVELDVEVYWKAFKNALAEVLLGAPSSRPQDIQALGISAQGETLICVDADGQPLRRAIVWLDNRAQDEAASLQREFGNEIQRISGQVSFVPTWPAAKILWLRRHEPDVFRRAARFLLIEDYFIQRLTGHTVCEGSLVSSTTYWNLTTRQWWPDMLVRLGISPERLPELRESGEAVAPILESVARELGLDPSTTVCTGALDQAAGAIGVGNISPGVFSENTGAALAICATVERPVFDPAGQMPCHYHGVPGRYMMHTFTTGGMVLRWFRDGFCQSEVEAAQALGRDPYDLLNELAATVEPGAEGLVMLPHLQGAMAPESNPKAKGVFYGFTLRHTKRHFVRSIMEAIACLVRRDIEVIENLGIPVDEVRVLGGGARSGVWNRIKCDLTGRPIVITENEEAACLGAAMLAGWAIGMFGSLEQAVERMVVVKDRLEPNPQRHELYDVAYARYRALYDDLRPTFDRS